MDIEKIKQRILDLAIRGKLVPQDPNDEPASVLIEKIKEEKEKLIKEGKIKPTKNESYIYKDSDNCYYEKIGNELINISDQIPFNIPNNWIWVRLKTVGAIIGGGTPSTSIKEYWDNGDIVWVTPAYMSSLTSIYIDNSYKKITKLGLSRSSAKLMPKGSIIMSSRAPIGYIGINTVEACTSQGCKSLVPFIFNTNHFLYFAIKASVSRIIEASKGTTFNEISGTKFGEILVPLAPLSEQERICKQIDFLYKSIGEIKDNILDIQREAKILKQKILNLFFCNNSSYKSYYENKSYNVVKLSQICNLNTGDSINKEEKSKEYTGLTKGYPYIGTKDVDVNHQINYENGVLIPDNKLSNFKVAPNGSILLCIEGGSAGKKIAITNKDVCFGNKLCCLEPKRILNEYLFYYLQSSAFKEAFKNQTSGLIGGVGINKLRNIEMHLPNIDEQNNVVQSIKEAFNMIAKLC